MLRRFLFFTALVLVAAFVFLQSRSSSYRVERSVRIGAPPEVVYRLLEDLHQWPRWSPWETLDPKLKHVYNGPERGAGATYDWEGNAQVGKGRLTVVEAAPPKSVTYDVAFEVPLQSDMKYEFVIAPAGEGSDLRWAFLGEHPFWAKLFAVFIDLDQQLGGDMQRGLTKLKGLAEQR